MRGWRIRGPVAGRIRVHFCCYSRVYTTDWLLRHLFDISSQVLWFLIGAVLCQLFSRSRLGMIGPAGLGSLRNLFWIEDIGSRRGGFGHTGCELEFTVTKWNRYLNECHTLIRRFRQEAHPLLGRPQNTILDERSQ